MCYNFSWESSDAINITFHKTGKEIKAAIQNRREHLELRLAARNAALDEFMRDSKKVRSYMVRQASGSTMPVGLHGRSRYALYSNADVSSEEAQEVAQLCRRIFEIEQELHRLALVAHHLKDDQVFDLNYDDLIGYGFEASLEVD